MNDEQQAFPDGLLNQDGMTLRDYFAEKAMQAIISSHDNTTLDFVSGKAYQYADAMLKAREA